MSAAGNCLNNCFELLLIFNVILPAWCAESLMFFVFLFRSPFLSSSGQLRNAGEAGES